MSLLRSAYQPLFIHLEHCAVCTSSPATMCQAARRLVYSCEAVAREVTRPIPPMPVVS